MYAIRAALPAFVAITALVIAALVASFKLVFQQARWTESVPPLIGGILVGGISGLATGLIA
jgi:hypothetical protein